MKVLIIDDQWVCRAGLKPLLSQIDKRAQIFEAATFDEAVKLVARNKDLSLVVLDLMVPGMKSLESIRDLLAKGSQAPIVVFSTVGNRHDILRAIEIGAAGFVPKTIDGEEIVKALGLILSGEIYLPRMLLKEAPRSGKDVISFVPPDTAPGESIGNLTDRQRQVLSFLSHGMTNTKIAKELGLSENTVRIHISAILRTLDLDNRTQAALLAAEYLRTANSL